MGREAKAGAGAPICTYSGSLRRVANSFPGTPGKLVSCCFLLFWCLQNWSAPPSPPPHTHTGSNSWGLGRKNTVCWCSATTPRVEFIFYCVLLMSLGMSGKDKGLFLVYRTRSRLDIVSVLLLICLKFIFMDRSLSLGIDWFLYWALPSFAILRIYSASPKPPGSPSNLQHF